MLSTSKTKSKLAVAKQVEPDSSALPNFWQFLVLKYQSPKAPVWYDLGGNSFEEVPRGQLVGVDFQAREFENKTDYRLLVSLCNGKNFFLLGMGLTTFSALSLVEPLCFLPTQILQSEIAIHHQVEVGLTNAYVKLLVEVEGSLLNVPLSSLTFWRKFGLKRVVQLQQKLGQPSLELQTLEEEEF
jgi:hypothetical protein